MFCNLDTPLLSTILINRTSLRLFKLEEYFRKESLSLKKEFTSSKSTMLQEVQSSTSQFMSEKGILYYQTFKIWDLSPDQTIKLQQHSPPLLLKNVN